MNKIKRFVKKHEVIISSCALAVGVAAISYWATGTALNSELKHYHVKIDLPKGYEIIKSISEKTES